MTKRAYVKFILIIAVLLMTALFGAAIYLVTNAGDFEQLVAAQIEARTGRKLEVGEARLAISLKPAVTFTDVRFANATWGSRPQMLRSASLTLKVDPLALLSGVVTIDQIILEDPEVIVETDSQGRSNWNFDQKTAPQRQAVDGNDEGSGLADFHLRLIKVSNGRFFYRDGATTQSVNLDVGHFSAAASGRESNLTLKLEASYKETPFEVQASVGPLHLLLQNNPSPFDASAKSPGLKVSGKGSIERPMDFTGLQMALNIEAEELASLTWLVGSNLPAIGPLEVSTRAKVQGSSYLLEQLKGTLGDSAVTGNLTIENQDPRPKVIADLMSTKLTLADWIGSSSADAEPHPEASAPENAGDNSTERVFSATPLPFEALQSFDADISLQAEQVELDSLPLQKLKLKLLLENGQLAVRNAATEVAGGTMTADLSINSASEPPEVTTRIVGSKVDLGEFLKGLKQDKFLTGGQTDMTLDLSGQGASMRDLAAGLNGELIFLTGEGQFLFDFGMVSNSMTLELLKKLNPLRKTPSDAKLKCFTLHCTSKDGVVTTDKGLALETDGLYLLGSGEIDLKAEQIKLLLSSKSTVANLLQVGGSLAKPEVKINSSGILKKGVSLGAAVLTGGLSMVPEQIFDWATSGGSPCKVARRKIPALP